MTKKQIEQREKALERSCGICPVCGKPLREGAIQYAHAISNTKTNREKFGSFFIDSTYNGCLVCSLRCNDAVNIGKSPDKVFSKLAEILTLEIKDRMGDNNYGFEDCQ